MKEILLVFTLGISPLDSQVVNFEHLEFPIIVEQGVKNSGEAEVYIPIADEFISIKWETICCPESNNDCENCDEID